jgi:drug/metabolite transporter (DMT)-like permease
MARLSGRYGGAVLSGLRFLIASPIVIVLMLLTGGGDQFIEAAPHTIAVIALSAFIGYGLGDTLYVQMLPRIGLQRMAPATTALFVAISAAGGVLLLGEHAGWPLFAGGAAVVAGTSLVVAARAQLLPDPSAARRPGVPTTLAILLFVASAWAVATLLLAGGRGDLGVLTVAAIRIPAGGLTIAATFTAASRGAILRRLPAAVDMPLVMAIGVVGTALGSVLYIYAVAEAGAARAVILNSTSPLMVVPLSMYFLKERPTRMLGAGTVLCLIGTLTVVALG